MNTRLKRLADLLKAGCNGYSKIFDYPVALTKEGGQTWFTGGTGWVGTPVDPHDPGAVWFHHQALFATAKGAIKTKQPLFLTQRGLEYSSGLVLVPALTGDLREDAIRHAESRQVFPETLETEPISKDALQSITTVSGCCSKDVTRRELMGVFYAKDPNSQNWETCATDGHRLRMVRHNPAPGNCACFGEKEQHYYNRTLSKETVAVVKWLNAPAQKDLLSDTQIYYNRNDHTPRGITGEGFGFLTEHNEGDTYPRYWNVIPVFENFDPQYRRSVTFPVAEMGSLLDMLEPMVNEGTHLFTLHLIPTQVEGHPRVEVWAGGRADGVEEGIHKKLCDVNWEAFALDTFRIGFNLKYFRDNLKSIPKECTTVTLQCISPVGATVIRTSTQQGTMHQLQLLMPLRLNND